MPDASPIDHMRRVAAVMERAPEAADAAAWFTSGFRRWQDAHREGAPISLDVALGLAVPGQRGWAYRERKGQRDACLRELHRRRFPHLQGRDAARAVVGLLQRQAVQPDADRMVAAALLAGAGLLKVRQVSRLLVGT